MIVFVVTSSLTREELNAAFSLMMNSGPFSPLGPGLPLSPLSPGRPGCPGRPVSPGIEKITTLY